MKYIAVPDCHHCPHHILSNSPCQAWRCDPRPPYIRQRFHEDGHDIGANEIAPWCPLESDGQHAVGQAEQEADNLRQQLTAAWAERDAVITMLNGLRAANLGLCRQVERAELLLRMMADAHDCICEDPEEECPVCMARYYFEPQTPQAAAPIIQIVEKKE